LIKKKNRKLQISCLLSRADQIFIVAPSPASGWLESSGPSGA
jgi:hypothetical protein